MKRTFGIPQVYKDPVTRSERGLVSEMLFKFVRGEWN